VNSVRWRAVIDRTATARVQRLIRWLELFKRSFGRRAQRLALRTYVQGVFSDSDRKSMWQPIYHTVVAVGTVAISLTLYEVSEYVPSVP